MRSFLLALTLVASSLASAQKVPIDNPYVRFGEKSEPTWFVYQPIRYAGTPHPILLRPRPVVHIYWMSKHEIHLDAKCTTGWTTDTSSLDIYPNPSIPQAIKAFGRMTCRHFSTSELWQQAEEARKSQEMEAAGWYVDQLSASDYFDIVYQIGDDDTRPTHKAGLAHRKGISPCGSRRPTR